MNWLRAITRFTLLTAILLISLVGLMRDFPLVFGSLTGQVGRTGEAIVGVWRVPGYNLFFLWLALLLLAIVHLLLYFMGGRKRVHVEIDTPEGRVCILDSAIRKYVQAVLARIPGVVTRRVELRSTRRGLQVDIFAHVRASDGLASIKQEMVDRVRDALTEEMGIPSVAGVDVLIEDFELKKPQTREPLLEPAPVAAPEAVHRVPPPKAAYPDDIVAKSPFLAASGTPDPVDSPLIATDTLGEPAPFEPLSLPDDLVPKSDDPEPKKDDY